MVHDATGRASRASRPAERSAACRLRRTGLGDVGPASSTAWGTASTAGPAAARAEAPSRHLVPGAALGGRPASLGAATGLTARTALEKAPDRGVALDRRPRAIDLADAAGRRARRLPAAAPALAPARAPARGSTSTGSSACSPTSSGPSPARVAVDGFELTRLALRRRGPVQRLRRRQVPAHGRLRAAGGVRIADADRVRLGAHLADGTTVMHEGFVNYNAGTLGYSMVEGRISAGVVVGDGSDVGGGASIMGTLSGGGTAGHLASASAACIGANAGIGISLGDDCVVEAGCYVTAGAKMTLPDGTRWSRRASSPGRAGLLFWRNSVTGALEARPRSGRGRRAERRRCTPTPSHREAP